MRSVCLAPVLLLTLAGCGLVHVPTDVAAPGMADPDGALRESIARVNQAMNGMGGKGCRAISRSSCRSSVATSRGRPAGQRGGMLCTGRTSAACGVSPGASLSSGYW